MSEVKAVAVRAENEFRLRSLPTIFFLDEIHRFDKTQQDILLPLVEKGFVVLVGATTENPSFAVNPVSVSFVQSAGIAVALPSDSAAIAVRFPDRLHSASRSAGGSGAGQKCDRLCNLSP